MTKVPPRQALLRLSHALRKAFPKPIDEHVLAETIQKYFHFEEYEQGVSFVTGIPRPDWWLLSDPKLLESTYLVLVGTDEVAALAGAIKVFERGGNVITHAERRLVNGQERWALHDDHRRSVFVTKTKLPKPDLELRHRVEKTLQRLRAFNDPRWEQRLADLGLKGIQVIDSIANVLQGQKLIPEPLAVVTPTKLRRFTTP